MKLSPSVFVADIIETMDVVGGFVANMTLADVRGDQKTEWADLYGFIIIGEAAKLVPPDVQARKSDVPWRQMAGMRDRVVHAYREVRIAVAWRAIHDDFPRIKPQLEKLLAELEAEEDEAD